jgi:solute carrier family 25 carnitine/acylcarnitine transporter 20/29
MLENATVFTSYGFMKSKLGVTDTDQPIHKLILCGGFSGIAVAVVLTPVELIKCRLQVQANALDSSSVSSIRYKGPIDVIRQTIKAEGVGGLFRGLQGTLLREIPGNMAWYGVYESMCKVMTPPGEDKSSLPLSKIMFAGGCSGAAYWSAFYPADTVKSKIQTDPRLMNSGFVDVFRVSSRLNFDL